MHYAAIGCWDFKKDKGGITICTVDEEGLISPLQNYFPNVNVGSTPALDENGILYFVDEVSNLNKVEYGGGGYIYAAKFNFQTAELCMLNRKKSLGTNPCYCAITSSKKYLAVVHHTSSKNTVTKIVRNQCGKIGNEILYDDTSVVLFGLNEDGSIGEPVDFYLHEREGKRHSLLHSVYEYKGFLLSSDKGLDRVYSYHIDESAGKIELADTLTVEKFTACRYMGFHPYLNRIYGTNEKRPFLNVYQIDEENGEMKKIAEEYVFEDLEYAKSNAKFQTDCVVSKCGRYLYVALAAFSGEDRIVTMDLDKFGVPKYRGYEILSGSCPKALAISQNGKYLYSCNTMSGTISCYEIMEDGALQFKSSSVVENAASIRFF